MITWAPEFTVKIKWFFFLGGESESWEAWRETPAAGPVQHWGQHWPLLLSHRHDYPALETHNCRLKVSLNLTVQKEKLEMFSLVKFLLGLMKLFFNSTLHQSQIVWHLHTVRDMEMCPALVIPNNIQYMLCLLLIQLHEGCCDSR